MSEVISVSPFRCRMWRGNPRLEECVDEGTCRAEINSFLSHGQKLPVLARPLRADRTHDFEIIYGTRRLFVARYLNQPLDLDLRDLTDQEAVIALDIENRLRKEMSPYERGRAYELWIRTGLFSSRDELARALRISPSQVSRLIRLAQLPPVIVNAFASPHEIRERWGQNLMELWEDPRRKPMVTAVAEAVTRESSRAPGELIFKRLAAATDNRSDNKPASPPDARDEVIRDEDGGLLFRVRRRRNDTAVLLPTSKIARKELSEIIRVVAEIMGRTRERTRRSSGRVHREDSRSGSVVRRLRSLESRPLE